MRGYSIYKLSDGTILEERILSTIRSIKKEAELKTIVKLEFYLDSYAQNEFKEVYTIINSILKLEFKDEIPASSILVIPAFKHENCLVLCETISNYQQVDFKKILNHHYVTITHENGVELISGGILHNEDSSLLTSQRSIDFVEQILMAEDMDYGHIFKQSSYISNANETCSYDRTNKSNLDSFKEIETLFCDPQLYKSGKQLSTYINYNHSGITVDFRAYNVHCGDSTISTDTSNINARHLNFNNPEIHFANCYNSNINDIEKETLKALADIYSFLNDYGNNKFEQSDFKQIKAYVKRKDFLPIVYDILDSALSSSKIIVLHSDNINNESNLELEGIIFA